MDKNRKACGSSSARSPPWIEPEELMENFLRRLDPVEKLNIAEKVCNTWRSVCSGASLWRVIRMTRSGDDVLCRRAVDRSQGELIDIHIEYFGTDDLLHYISQRSSCLKCLKLGRCDSISGNGLTKSVKDFPELEELHLFFMSRITAEDIKVIGISCPKLKSFTFNNRSYKRNFSYIVEIEDDSCAFSIARNMANLHHLCLFGNRLSNEGLKAILNGCPNLELLDLRKCHRVDLQGDFGKICLERIKYLKCPYDSIEDFDYDVDYDSDDTVYDHGYYCSDSSDYDYEYDPFLYR
ncbi:hypothetical protein CASFOL_014520 [Castilleja foliolosa]|uniref:F-box domain-containing protein n=1 Tax=Castilleja foliolosa TaxID=1961234 RepID=A0ABD3DS84_9LAMI